MGRKDEEIKNGRDKERDRQRETRREGRDERDDDDRDRRRSGDKVKKNDNYYLHRYDNRPQKKVVEQGAGIGATNNEEDRKGPEQEHNQKEEEKQGPRNQITER